MRIVDHSYVAHRTFAVVVVASAAVWSVHTAVAGWTTIHARDHDPLPVHTVEAVGVASEHAMPTRIAWAITVEIHDKSRIAAERELRDRALQTHDFLTGHGVHEDEIQIDAASVEQDTPVELNGGIGEYKAPPGDWTATQRFQVISADIRRQLEAYRVAALGLPTLQFESPGCLTAAASDALQDLARRRAREQAKTTVAELGGTLGDLVQADQPVVAVDPNASWKIVCEQGIETTARVHVIYQLEH